MAIHYHDDPIEETPAPRRKVPGILASILILLVGGLFLNTTLAANISINSGTAVATRCLGNNAAPLGLSPGSYWSSSERDASNSWVLNFSTTYAGGDYANAKSATVSVRPIRAF